MTHVSDATVDAYRAETFRLTEETRVHTKEEAIAFVEARGFVFFWPIKGVTFPSLWAAVAGNRPVADKHDDPGHVTWGWKDEMLGTRQWYYAKVLRGKATMIARDVAPYFYALSENYGEPEADYLQQYADGLLSREAKLIYETILREGPLDTVRLRRKIQMTRRKSDSPFARGMTQLQRDFKILPVGVARTGGWRYSFIYDTVHRHFPDLPEKARAISRTKARQQLMSLALASTGIALEGDMRKIFRWKPQEIRRTLAALQETGTLEAIPGSSPSKTVYVWHAVKARGDRR